MLTRRETVTGAASAAALMRIGPALAKASQPATPVNFDVPANACDCHTHFIGDPAKFPFAPTRGYTPEQVTAAEMKALHRALHIKRVVIVTPSVYGTDNSAMLYGIKSQGPDARGVAVIDDKTSDGDLDSFAKAGVRGIRLYVPGTHDSALVRQRFQDVLPRVQRLDWHIQIQSDIGMVTALKDLVTASPVPVVFDHFGSAPAAKGAEQPGFVDLVALIQSGKAYVKISGAYRISKQGPDYLDVVPLAQALVAANPQRIVWGTDWPHTGGKTGLMPIDDGRLMNQLPVWVPDAAARKAILVDNPARLYRF